MPRKDSTEGGNLAWPPRWASGCRIEGREHSEKRRLTHRLWEDAPPRGAPAAGVSTPPPQRGGSGSSAGGRRLRRRLFDRRRPPRRRRRGAEPTGDLHRRQRRHGQSRPDRLYGRDRLRQHLHNGASTRHLDGATYHRFRAVDHHRDDRAGHRRHAGPARPHRPQVDRPHLRRQLPRDESLQHHQGAAGIRRPRHLLHHRSLSGSGPRPRPRDRSSRIRGGRPHSQSLELPHPFETRTEDRDRQRYRSLSRAYRCSHRAPLPPSGRLHRRQDP